jgi:hypothetical protein
LRAWYFYLDATKRAKRTRMTQSDQIWDVPCWLCGFKLGSNKANCGKGTRCKIPPCVWAHTDDAIVRKCFSRESERQRQKEEEERQLAETAAKYANGQLSFSEDEAEGEDEGNAPEVEDLSQRPPEATIDALLKEQELLDKDFQDLRQKQDAHKAATMPPPESKKRVSSGGGSANAKKQREEKESGEEDDAGKKTKWNSMTRTMFFRCIQKRDPFSAADKGATWQLVADDMAASTESLMHTADGDFRVYSNGKTLSVLYSRLRDKFKKEEDAEPHSGHARGKEENPANKEERQQLAGCIEIEKEAKVAGEQKREVNKCYDDLRKGEVNEAIIAYAVKHGNLRTKAAKVLADRLRKLKIRKIAYEQTNKNGKYTYTAQDMEDVALWDKLKKADSTLPDDPVTAESDCAVERKGGAMANALTLLSEKLSTTSNFQPMMPSDFASAFYAAKRAHEEQGKRSLKEKLSIVDADVVEGVITAEEAKEYKKKITDAHYAAL